MEGAIATKYKNASSKPMINIILLALSLDVIAFPWSSK